LESSDAGVLLFSWRGCLFRVPDQVQAPKAGSLFFCRHLLVRRDECVLEIGDDLGNGRLRNAGSCRQRSDGLLAFATQPFEEGTPRRIGKRTKEGIVGLRHGAVSKYITSGLLVYI